MEVLESSGLGQPMDNIGQRPGMPISNDPENCCRTPNMAFRTLSEVISLWLARFAMRAALEDPEDIHAMAFLTSRLWVTVGLIFDGEWRDRTAIRTMIADREDEVDWQRMRL